MTRTEAEKILGRADSVVGSGRGSETWHYQVPFRFGWVDVFFDLEGRIMEYNYERF